MNPTRVISSLLAALVVASGAFASEPPATVSIAGVIADPQRYTGKHLRLAGFARIAFERQELCLVLDPPSKKECLWIEIDKGPYVDERDHDRFNKAFDAWLQWNGKAVMIEVDFTASDPNFRQYAGVLRNVGRPVPSNGAALASPQ